MGSASVEEMDVVKVKADASAERSKAMINSDRAVRVNVMGMYALAMLSGIIEMAVIGPLLTIYLYDLASAMGSENPNTWVGGNQAVAGLLKLAAAAGVGWVLDRRPTQRRGPLRCSALLGATALAAATALLCSDGLVFVPAVTVSCALFVEVSGIAAQSIFTDSLPQGQRASAFVMKSIFELVGHATGPLLAAAVAAGTHGSTLNSVKVAWGCCASILVPSSAVVFAFSDPPASTPCSSQRASLACSRGTVVPYICLVFQLVGAFAAGLMVPFLSVFFIEQVKLSLVHVNLLEGASCFITALLSQLSVIFARYWGRAITILVLFTLSTSFTVLLAVQSSPLMLQGVFLLRMGLAGAPRPLVESLVADWTPSSQRGVWNAMLRMAYGVLSCAAFLGGNLADSHGYRYVFWLSSAVYAGCGCLFLPVICLAKETPAVKQTESDEEAEPAEPN